MFSDCFDVLCNIFFKEHFPEDGHNRCAKHAGSYAVYSTINLHICLCIYWFCGFVSHNTFLFFVHIGNKQRISLCTALSQQFSKPSRSLFTA